MWCCCASWATHTQRTPAFHVASCCTEQQARGAQTRRSSVEGSRRRRGIAQLNCRVSHGTSFLAPGSLARRRLARAIHRHHGNCAIKKRPRRGPLASVRQHLENQKENQAAGHSRGAFAGQCCQIRKPPYENTRISVRIQSLKKYGENTAKTRTSEYCHAGQGGWPPFSCSLHATRSAARPAGGVGRGRVCARGRVRLRERRRLRPCQ